MPTVASAVVSSEYMEQQLHKLLAQLLLQCSDALEDLWDTN